MRRSFIAAVSIFLFASLPGTLSAQTPDDCYQATLRTNDAEIIRICTAALRGNLNAENRSITTSNRGLGYLRDRQFDNAIQDFSEALRIDPRNPFAYNFRGEAWREKGNYDRALSDFAEALRVDPSFTGAIYNLGMTHEKRGDTGAARAEYRRALATRGDRALDKWARDRAKERLAALGDNDTRPKRGSDQPDVGGSRIRE